MSNKPSFVWKAPSPKQEQILYWWWPGNPYANCSYIELEGAVRAAKTITASYSFVNWATYTFDQEDLALCSKTIGTCLRNVVRPLKRILSEEPNYEVKEYRANAEGHRLEITDIDLDRTNSYFIYGGKDESSQDLLQGKTLAGGLADEALLYPISFLNQLLSRMSVEGSKVWFTFNPEAPTHETYVNILDPYVADRKAFYLHLTMDDNPDLSQEAKDRISSQWPVGSVWHRRNVLGQRVAAEGAVFPFFTTDPKDGFVVNKLPNDLTTWLMAGDYGQQHWTVYVLAGYSASMRRWVVVKSFFTKDKTNVVYSQEFKREILNYNGGIQLLEANIDPGGGGLSLVKQFAEDYDNISVSSATKKDVAKEIQDLASGLFTHKICLYGPGNKQGIEQLVSYMWNDKAKSRGKDEPLKVNDDFPDALRYLYQMILRYS